MKNYITYHKYRPTTKDELEHIIEDRISKEGPNCDLNDIDVSLIDDMSWLFYESKFNGDISKWKISKDCNTCYMLSCCYIKDEFKPKALQ